MIELSNTPRKLSPEIYNLHHNENGTLSTFPGPRSGTGSPIENTSPSTTRFDLDNEVATLSNKLVKAINHQTNLDDTLSETRNQLEAAQEQVRVLERENRLHLDLLSRGFLVRKSAADSAQATLTAKLTEERKKRLEIEKDKKSMEQELETLTTALFEEANKMVVATREKAEKEVTNVKRKNEKLKEHLSDTEMLLRSHQDQLAELKQVVEQMTERCEVQTNATSPSSLGFRNSCSKESLESNMENIHALPLQESFTPTYPTSFTHLLQMVLRNDIPSYDEFTSLLRAPKKLAGGGRMSTGSYSGIGISLGLSSHSRLASARSTNGSTSSISTLSTSPATPMTPCSTTSTSSKNGPNLSSSLKETKFFKRVLVEDIEPTLRLDSAPGLSWLARRSFTNAVCEGTLIVEPMPSSSSPGKNSNACALCSESRSEPEFSRSHRFRIGENENAQRYPLCRYCLGRVRSTCDFVGFLRLLKDGLWKCDDEDSERAAWEESVRLREQMFWCRMGGGVIPVIHYHQHESFKSPDTTDNHVIEQDQQYAKKFEPHQNESRRSVPAEDSRESEKLIPGARNRKNSTHELELNKIEQENDKKLAQTSPLKIVLQDEEERKRSKSLSISIPGTFE